MLVRYPKPNPNCMALNHKAAYEKPHSRHRQFFSDEGNVSVAQVCVSVSVRI